MITISSTIPRSKEANQQHISPIHENQQLYSLWLRICSSHSLIPRSASGHNRLCRNPHLELSKSASFLESTDRVRGPIAAAKHHLNLLTLKMLRHKLQEWHISRRNPCLRNPHTLIHGTQVLASRGVGVLDWSPTVEE